MKADMPMSNVVSNSVDRGEVWGYIPLKIENLTHFVFACVRQFFYHYPPPSSESSFFNICMVNDSYILKHFYRADVLKLAVPVTFG